MATDASVLDATAAVRPLNHSCELCLVLSSVKACAREIIAVECFTLFKFYENFHLNTTAQPTNSLG